MPGHRTRRTCSLSAMCIALTLLMTAAIVAQKNANGTVSTRDGVFTIAQAERGGRVYDTRCGLCHQPDQFTGPAFVQSWNGQPAHALFTLIRTTMPQENPGGLKREEYAEVLAYLFRLNGLPAGKAELESNDEALKRVVMEFPLAGQP